jgi:pyrroline-5-carboxylate reductase
VPCLIDPKETLIMTDKTIGFIGGGRVARILLGGWQRAGQMPAHIVVSDTNAEVLLKLKAQFPAITVAAGDNLQPAAHEIVFLGLHPPVIGSLLGEIRPALKPGALFVSLAPKLSLAKLSEGLGGFGRLARMIPNAPSIVNEGYNPVAFAPTLAEADRAELLGLFGMLGKCPEVAEEKLEAYAILTAMGPTYLWFQLYELQSIAESFGLTRQEVGVGLSEMAAAAVKTMSLSGLASAEVMDLVPVKPLGEDETAIKGFYHARLEALYKKLKG